ncbi:uncharacterized protein WCC33_005612 [Rhinophrynus dorsalis]
MFQAPSFLLTLSFIILHSGFLCAVPIEEEQRHQTIHRSPHGNSELADLQEAPLLPRSQQEKREDVQEKASSQILPPSGAEEGDELFKDISPKALAAVLLQALNGEGEEQAPSSLGEKNPPEDPKPVKEEEEEDSGLTERVRSRTRSSEKEVEETKDEKTGEEEDMESVKSLLQELEGFEPPPKREQEPVQDPSPDSDDLEELKELLGLGEQREEEKRSPSKSALETPQSWEGEEESEKLAGVAQDLLLQYLMNGGENGGEQEEEEKEGEGGEEEEEDYQGGDLVGGQRPLFEDEEEGNIQDKRSDEDYGDEVDPQTIDKLIELSSRLHLPADDVVDIINDVEKRKRRKMKKKKARDDLPRRKDRTRTPPQSWPEAPKPAYYPRRRLEQEPFWNKMPDTTWNKVKEPSWNKVPDQSWNKVPDQSWNKVPDQSWNKVSDQSWNKVPDQSWNKVSDQSWNKVPDQSWNKVSDQSWNEVSEPSWNKMSKPGRNKITQPSWNKVSESSWNKASKPSWNKLSQQNWNKASQPSWNKMSQPSWNKVSQPSWNKVSQPSWNKVSEPSWNKVSEPSWYKVSEPKWKKVMEPAPRRYRSRPAPYTNYIRPRAFQTPPRSYYKPPAPQREDYYDEDQDKQEEMENYIERILLTHPEVFQ